jgi:hypothetical protein
MLGGEIDGLCSFQAAIRWRRQRQISVIDKTGALGKFPTGRRFFRQRTVIGR